MSKVLIVDDDGELVNLLATLLKDAGHEVEAVTNSLRAYDRVKETHPDLVLMDLRMPYLDGTDELKIFGLDEELKNLPVIIVTGDRRMFRQIDNPAKYGIVDAVFKPFELRVLLEKIAAALDNAKPANRVHN